MELSGRIEQLRAEGRFESEGGFTIGLRHAREKLQKYLGVPQDHYLVLLVSAGIARGATSVEIRRDDCELSVIFPGALLTPRELSQGFANLLSGDSPPSTLDLTLGLQGAFRAGSLVTQMEATGPDGGFSWKVEQDRETFKEREDGGESRLEVRIHFLERNVVNRARSWLRNLGGYVGMTVECRAVDRLCEYAPVSIRINGTLVNRPFHPVSAPIVARIGVPPAAVLGEQRVLETGGLIPGVLALSRGEVRVVIHGVTHAGPRYLGLDGLVCCDDLHRDLSRFRLVEDEAMESLCNELRKLRETLLRELIPHLGGLGEWADLVDVGLRELFREGRLDRAEMETVLRFLKQADGLGGIELQRISLLQAVASRFEATAQKEEREWVAYQGLRLALEAFRRGEPGREQLETLLFFSRLSVGSLSITTVESLFQALEHWEGLRPKRLEGTLWEELLAVSLCTLLAFKAGNSSRTGGEGKLEAMIGSRLRNRLRPQALGQALEILDACDQAWAAEVALDMLRLSTERHGFRDDRLLARYLGFRARCSRYQAGGKPDWNVSHLLTEASFLVVIAYREPGLIGKDIATDWAPALISELEVYASEPSLQEEEKSRIRSSLGLLRSVVAKLQ